MLGLKVDADGGCACVCKTRLLIKDFWKGG